MCKHIDHADMVSVYSRWLRRHTFFANIFAKTKKFAKLSLPVHMGPRSNLLGKTKVKKSRDAVPLKISHFYY